MGSREEPGDRGREAVGAFYEQGREREVRIESVRDEQCGSREEKRIKL